MIKIRQYVAKKLYSAADRINVPVNDWETPLMVQAKLACQAADNLDASGEYKRHIVYANLMKQFPEMRHCDLAAAIERVIQELRRND